MGERKTFEEKFKELRFQDFGRALKVSKLPSSKRNDIVK